MSRVNTIFRFSTSSLIFIIKYFPSKLKSEPVIILNYHRICEEGYSRSATGVSPYVFGKQVEYLFKKHYKIISLHDLQDHIRKGEKLPEKAVIITFDDGYMDNYTQAFPILAKYRFKATVFLITSLIGGKNYDAPMLGWDQIKEMAKYGIDFGSHTVRHPYLTKLPIDAARKEIQESKYLLEQGLGKKVTLFCYPYGNLNNIVKSFVKESGYISACSTIQGGNTLKTDLLKLKRIWMSPRDNLFDLKKKLIGAYDLLYNIKAKQFQATF